MIRRERSRYNRGETTAKHKINRYISASQVRLVGDNLKIGIYPVAKALSIADDLGLDLVEISPKADPPVCKIIDYKKFLYDQKKKQKEIKSRAHKVSLKEIRFGPNTEDHDFEFKLKHARNFLEEGSKLKTYVFFKGRTIIYKERGQIILLKLAKALEDIATVESMPLMEGKRMIMLLAPKKKINS